MSTNTSTNATPISVRWIGDNNPQFVGVTDVTLSYKKKGKVGGPFNFDGRVWTRLEDGTIKIASPKAIEESPFYKDGHFDLTGIPVVSVSVKKIDGILKNLEEKFPGFQGVFYFFGYDEAMAFHDDELIFSSPAVLAGTEEVRRHHLHEAWTAPRWENGYLVRDRVWQTHYGQNIRTIRRSVRHQDVQVLVERVIANLRFHSRYVYEADALRLGGPMAVELHKAEKLWKRKHIGFHEKFGYIPQIPFLDNLQEILLQKFSEMGIYHLAEMPEGFSVPLAEVMPDLWAERDTV